MALATGSIAFTGYNATGNDDFALVVLSTITASETVHFTDNEWTGAAFNTGEGFITWVTPASLAAGTVVVFTGVNALGGPTVSTGSISAFGGMALSTAGDSILAYQGASPTATPSTFIAAVSWDELGFTQDGWSLAGTGLAVGTNSIVFGGGVDSPDMGEYAGDRTSQATFGGYLGQVNNTANWQIISSSATANDILPFNTTSFATGAADVAAPLLSSSSPADNATNVAVGANIVLTFNENIVAGAGTITIRDGATDAVVATIASNGPRVSIAGNVATIDPVADLDTAERYYVEVSAGAFEDAAGNDFAGISGRFALSFSTVLPAISAAPAGLGAGSIAFTGVSAEGVTDDLAFVVLQDLDGSINPFQIFFTDQAWTGAAFNTAADGILTWTVDEFIAAGTVVNFSDVGNVTGNAFDFGASRGFLSETGSFDVSTAGETVLAYVGSSAAPRANGFLAGIATSPTGFADDGGTLAGTGLTIGLTAADFGALLPVNGYDGVAYVGDRSSLTSFADYLSVINGPPLSADWTLADDALVITDGETLSPFDATPFTLGVDVTGPVLSSTSPADQSAGVAVGSNLSLTFNEQIAAGAGNIRIYAKNGDTLVETLSVGGPRVTIGGNTATIDPVADLSPGTAYYVQVDAGAFQDLAGNDFAGIADETTFNFSTAVTLGAVTFSPGDIAFAGFNADGNDDFAIVVLRDMDGASTPFQLFFTDRTWNGAAFVDSGEGTVTWTVASFIAAGTVVTFSDLNAPVAAGFEVSHGVITTTGGFDLAGAGDTLLAYQGTLAAPLANQFLAGIANDEAGFTLNGGTLAGTGLIAGTNAVSLSDGVTSPDGGEYFGQRTGQGSFASYLPLVNSSANWLLSLDDGELLLPHDATVFSISSPPVIAVNAGSTVTEGGTESITTSELSVTDADTANGSLVFTVSGNAATNGVLWVDADGNDAVNGAEAPIGLGGTFTQADIVAGRLKYLHDGSETVADSFGFIVSDGTTALPQATFNLIVTAVDDPGIARDDSFTTDELSAIGPGLNLFDDNGSGADADVDSAPAIVGVNGSAVAVGQTILLPSGASLRVNADGTFTYDPNGAFQFVPAPASGASNLTSTDSFAYTLAGGDEATVTITISGVENDDLLIGTAGVDGLVGGAGNDTVDGLEGVDQLAGDTGDDVFVVREGDTASGETYDGGADTDTIRVTGGGTVSLRGVTVTNVESIVFTSLEGTTLLLDDETLAGLVASAPGLTDRVEIGTWTGGDYDLGVLFSLLDAGVEQIGFAGYRGNNVEVTRDDNGTPGDLNDDRVRLVFTDAPGGDEKFYQTQTKVFERDGDIRGNDTLFDLGHTASTLFDENGAIISNAITDGPGNVLSYQNYQATYAAGVIVQSTLTDDFGNTTVTDYAAGVKTRTTQTDGAEGTPADRAIWTTVTTDFHANGAAAQRVTVYDAGEALKQMTATWDAAGLQTGLSRTFANDDVRTDVFINGALALTTILSAATGARTVTGQAQANTISGGTGNDLLRGGGGDDIFLFAGTIGNDRIADFDANPGDRLDLTAYGVDSLADFTANPNGYSVAQFGKNTVIDLGVDGTITLLNFQIGNLDDGDFVV